MVSSPKLGRLNRHNLGSSQFRMENGELVFQGHIIVFPKNMNRCAIMIEYNITRLAPICFEIYTRQRKPDNITFIGTLQLGSGNSQPSQWTGK